MSPISDNYSAVARPGGCLIPRHGRGHLVRPPGPHLRRHLNV